MRPKKKMSLELMPTLACTSVWGMRQSGREHGKDRGLAAGGSWVTAHLCTSSVVNSRMM